MENLTVELWGVLLAGGGALVLLMQYMAKRYGINNEAMTIALEAQRQINEMGRENQKAALLNAVESGRLSAKVEMLTAQLQTEQARNTELNEKLITSDATHTAEIEKLKTDSDKKILYLTGQVGELQRMVNEIKERLEKAERDKAQLITEKAELIQQKASADDTIGSLEARVKALSADIGDVKTRYEERIKALEAAIAEKDAEIVRLKLEIGIKDDDAKIDTPNNDSSDVVGSGGDGSGG